MIGKKIESTIRLRRDNDYNFEAIKDTFVPANGEVILVDTAKTGLRAKVGDGVSTYAELQYVDQDIRNAVLQGYYENGVFYIDETLSTPFPNMIDKVYIDKIRTKIYYFNGINYIPIDETLNTASAITPGIMKLYSTMGYNTDGTMTQKSITDELELRYKASIDPDEELLVFSR
jgi:hypothetical protein